VDRAWLAFVNAYTPRLVALIERGGVRDHDEAMEVYTLVCERLTADSCARLRRRDSSKGGLGAWLAVVVRHAVVDWVRQRAGRRRLFGAVRRLEELAQGQGSTYQGPSPWLMSGSYFRMGRVESARTARALPVDQTADGSCHEEQRE
jgi:DNA-directed RNA polymerase specialized sigma24 family protein